MHVNTISGLTNLMEDQVIEGRVSKDSPLIPFRLNHEYAKLDIDALISFRSAPMYVND